VYDRRSRRLWRHLDLAGRRCFVRMPLRRLRCPGHGVVTEAVPFAPPRSGYTYAFEDVVAWLAQRADKTAITVLLRISWRSVGRVLERWIARHRSSDVLDGLTRINVDEKSWRRGRRYVTVVAAPGPPARVVWMSAGRDEATLGAFFDELGPERTEKLEAVGTDMAAWYLEAIADRAPHAVVCIDPFHVVALANRALDEVRRGEWNRARREGLEARAVKYTRWALLKHPDRLNADQRATLALVRRHNARLWRGYEIKEMVRAVYGRPDEAATWLDGAIRRAARSRLRAFQALARTLRQYRDPIIAAVEHGLSNSPLEALNSRLALLNHRAAGFHSAAAFIALAMLCVGGFKPALPQL
jgi:transposase